MPVPGPCRPLAGPGLPVAQHEAQPHAGAPSSSTAGRAVSPALTAQPHALPGFWQMEVLGQALWRGWHPAQSQVHLQGSGRKRPCGGCTGSRWTPAGQRRPSRLAGSLTHRACLCCPLVSRDYNCGSHPHCQHHQHCWQGWELGCWAQSSHQRWYLGSQAQRNHKTPTGSAPSWGRKSVPQEDRGAMRQEGV